MPCGEVGTSLADDRAVPRETRRNWLKYKYQIQSLRRRFLLELFHS